MAILKLKGSADVTTYVFIQDATDGSPETGITITDLDIQYVRNGVAPVAKVDATALAAVDSVHSDNKMFEVDATDQPGLYRLDLPDAAFAAGVPDVVATVKGTGFQPVNKEFQLVGFDPEDAVRLGLTALPNAAADAAGGLPISDAGGLDLDTQLANTDEVTAARMAELDPANLPADVAAIPTTAMRGTDSGPTKVEMDAAHGLLATPAQVNAQVVDVLFVDTDAEPGQGAPAATNTIAAKIGYLFKAWRNKQDQNKTTGVQSLYNDAGGVVDQKSTNSDDGTTFERGEMGTGP